MLQDWILMASTECQEIWRWFRSSASWWTTVRREVEDWDEPSASGGSSDAVISYQESLLLNQDKCHLILFYSFWRLLNHNTHTLYTCLKPLIGPPHDILMRENCWFLQSEQWPQTAATCSQWSWYKVDSGRREKKKKKGRLHVLLCLLVLCIVCCINVNTSVKNSSERPPTDMTCRAERRRGCAPSSLVLVLSLA